MQVYELLDSAKVSGKAVCELFAPFSEIGIKSSTQTIKGSEGSTDFVRILVPGTNGKSKGGKAPTLGIIGRLGGIGARPSRIGLVSDADGAIAAIASALKLAYMAQNGDLLAGDVIITTHICPNAPTKPHKPVDFMGSPVDMGDMNKYEVDAACDAILSIDTTKGNNLINHKGVAISNTVKEGWILRASEDLLRLLEYASGQRPVMFPISMQDITPYGNGAYHLNSILQPAIATSAPVVGVAITAAGVVPGCATGASHEVDIALAVRFALEVAKDYGKGLASFYDAEEFELLRGKYGDMKVLQSMGK